MNKTRTHLAIIALAASMSLLAACSKEESTSADPAAPTTEPAAPAPSTAPESTTPDTTTPAPSNSAADAPITMASAETKPTAGEQLKEDAKNAGDTVADKAGQAKDAAAGAASKTGNAIREGADKADKAIQKKFGDGSPSTDQTPPENQG